MNARIAGHGTSRPIRLGRNTRSSEKVDMPRRKQSSLHDFWHPRVEGQIKHTIGRHPEWFRLPPKTSAKQDCISSLAKRIVGEIVAATTRGDNAGLHESNCAGQ